VWQLLQPNDRCKFYRGEKKLEELCCIPKPIEAAQNDGDDALMDEWYEYQFEWDASKAQRNARDHKD